jgi:hypothetical protein
MHYSFRTLINAWVATSLFLVSASSGLAQDSLRYKKLMSNVDYRPGHIVDRNGNKIQGLIYDKQDPDEGTSLSYFVTIVTPDGKQVRYTPKDLKEYSISYQRYVSDSTVFLQAVKDGVRIGLFKVITPRTTYMPAGTGSLNGAPIVGSVKHVSISETYYLKRVNEKRFTRVRKGTFMDVISAYFSDCPDLSKKIKTRELTIKDLEKIVYTYNYFCK